MIQTIYLTLNGGFSEEEVYGVCADKDLASLRCVLKGYAYQSSDLAILRAAKPDGTVCYISGSKEGENAFRFILSEQITAVEGDVRCDININRGNGTVSSDEFILKVRPPTAIGEMKESDSEYTGLRELILDTMEASAITIEEIDQIWEEWNEE